MNTPKLLKTKFEGRIIYCLWKIINRIIWDLAIFKNIKKQIFMWTLKKNTICWPWAWGKKPQSLDLASRTLTEYILFRQNVIEKLKNIDEKDRESVIHNILIPMKNVFEEQTFADDIYRNNIWVLDDKYMTYDTILSDKEMSDVVNVITEGGSIWQWWRQTWYCSYILRRPQRNK